MPDIKNVKGVSLAPLPLHEAGIQILARLKGLEGLGVHVWDGGVTWTMFAHLKREMKLHNPDVPIYAGDKNDNPVD